jgi:hypothetical protein
VTSSGGSNPILTSSFLQDDRSRDASALFSSTQSTLFFVVRSQGQSTPISWADGAGGGPLSLALQEIGSSSSTLITFHDGDGGGSDIRATAPSFSGGWHLLTMERNGSTGQIRVDGAPLTLESGFNSFSSPVAVTGTLPLLFGGIGLGGPGGNPQLGDSLDLAGIFNYKSALSPSDVNQNEQALSAAYGIALVPEPLCGSVLAAVGLVLWGAHRRIQK